MAFTSVNKYTDHFRIKLYTGNSTNDTAITWDESSNMKPDWLWIKNRSEAQSHALFDSTRGANKRFTSNGNGAETTENTNLDSFDTNGFTVDNELIVNGNGDNMVAWGWKCNGGTTSTNTDGTISSTVQVNSTAGFSIVQWTGDGSESATVGHGLGAKVNCIITRERDGGDWWHNWQTGLSGNSYNLFFNNSDAERAEVGDGHIKNLDNTTTFGFESSTSNVNAVNHSGITNIAYCFTEKPGFSKFGSYVGNGNSSGPFIYTGFKPFFTIIKRIDVGNDWNMQDYKRNVNGVDKILQANNDNAENVGGGYKVDKLSNGFKCRESGTETNADGGTYAYWAFGQSIVGSNNVPATAR